jgi:hypothetical protein
MLSAQVRKLDEQRRREELLFGDGKDQASKELTGEINP